MRNRLGLVALTLVSLLPTVTSECVTDEDVLANLFRTSARRDEQKTSVKLELKVDEWSFESKRNRLNIDGRAVFTWKNFSLDFSHLNPCSKSINLRKSQVWTPPISFSNAAALSLHENTASLRLNEDGTILFSERVQQLAPCQISSESLPFGNVSCSVVFENRDSNRASFEWRSADSVDGFPSSAGSLSLRDVTSSASASSSGDDEENLSLTVVFSQNVQSLLIHFFIPSLLFLIPPWLTLLLGPMAITRCCILMTSLILLSIHYHANLLDVPHFNGVDAIAVWKLFSFLFVVLLVVELVVITLLASIGRSRSCCYPKGRSAKYEMEPLYEEMNDLRQRKTRKTRNCCRMTALSVDIVSFVLFGVVLLLFCYGFYAERSAIVRMINEFEMESLYIL